MGLVAEVLAKTENLSSLEAKMEIITSTQDIRVGDEILIFCKGEAFQFEQMANKTWV